MPGFIRSERYLPAGHINRYVRPGAPSDLIKSGINSMEQRTFTTPHGNEVIILNPLGRLDITTAWQFRLRLQETISEATPHILVNLSEVNFIDSSGLTSLVAGMRDADKIDGSFRICNVHPEAKLVFEVTMMDSVFEIYDTEAEALSAPCKQAVA